MREMSLDCWLAEPIVIITDGGSGPSPRVLPTSLFTSQHYNIYVHRKIMRL